MVPICISSHLMNTTTPHRGSVTLCNLQDRIHHLKPTAVISSPHSLASSSRHTVHAPPPPPPLHRGGRRPRPAADPRGPDGVRRPRRLRHPPGPRRRATPLRAAPRLPPLSIAAPRGDRSSRPLSPAALGMSLTCSGLRCATAASGGSLRRVASRAGDTTSAATHAGSTPR